jgi:hypothetical protein
MTILHPARFRILKILPIGTIFAKYYPSSSLRTGCVDMLFLRFRNSSGNWTIGPTDSIEIRGADLLFPNRTAPVARFQRGWLLDEHSCNLVECRSTLSIQFEDETGRIGPVIGLRTAFYLRGVYAFAGREQIAKLDPIAGTWFRPNQREHWPRLRVLPAP